MVAQRVLHPASKLATARLLHSTTLAGELALGEVDENELFAAMDWLFKRQLRIEKKLAARHLSEGAQVLHDVSSSYYEGHTCSLMQFGYSRDGKRGRPIVVHGLLTDAAGRPVAMQAYPGNTGDPATVPDQVEKLRGRFGLQRVVLVGDRGMLTQTQVEQIRQHPGLGWISALRHSAIRQLAEGGALQLSLFDEQYLAEIRSDAYPGERLVVCRNPALAQRRTAKREDLLAATEEAFEKIRREVARRTKTPLSATAIAEKAGRVKNRFKMAKHFALTIADGVFHYQRDTVTMEREATLDGFHIVRTSESAERVSADDVVRSYKNLARVESAFRSRRCCLPTRNSSRPAPSATPFCPPNRPPRPSRKKRAVRSGTAWPCTAWKPCLPNSPLAANASAGSGPTPATPPCNASPNLSLCMIVRSNSSACSQCAAFQTPE